MPYKIVITGRVPESGISMLRRRKGYRVVTHSKGQTLSRAKLLQFVRGADAILSLLTDKIDERVMDAAGKRLHIIANYAVGFDNIDLAAARKRKIYVTNTPGVLTQAVAEHAFALLLAAAKRIVEADRFVRAGKYKGWEPDLLIGSELEGKAIGVVGLGRIGSSVAKIARQGYGMRVLYTNPQRVRDIEQAYEAKYMKLPQLLRQSDFVSIHVPLTPETRHLIGRKELSLMKSSAVLVNTSRGPVIDEQALVWALRKGEIFAAGLDVYEHEPKLAPGLAKLPNVVLTPHIASGTREARSAMAEIAARNIMQALSGKTPSNIVK